MEPWFQRRLEEMMSTYVSRIDGMLNSRLEALKQDVRSNIADLRRQCRRVPGRDNAERAKEIMDTTATATAPSTTTGDLCASSARASSSLRISPLAPAAAASASSSMSTSTWSTASSTSWGAISLRAPTATDNSTPTTTSASSGSSGIASCVASSTGAIGVPPSTSLSDADQVLDAPATCSTLSLYPVASAIQVNKAPLPVMDEFLTAPTSVEFLPTAIHSFLGPGHDSDFVHTAAPEVLEFGTQSPSTATPDAVSELVAPVESDKVHGDEAINLTTLAPTICSAECSASNIHTPPPAFSTTRVMPSIPAA